MPASQTRNETKTADELLFNHYLRTGQRLTGQAAQAFLERKAEFVPDRPAEQKSAEGVLFEHYLRTGQRLHGEVAQQFVEQKFNPNHDPDDGRFTFGPGGASLPPRTFAARPLHMAVMRNLPLPGSISAKPKPKPTANPSPWARTHPGEQLPVWRPRDRSTERGLPSNWRQGTRENMELDEVERRADNAQRQFYYNWGRGMSLEEAAAWAANSEVESRSNPTANQDGGAPGRGLFQWETPGRADTFKKRYGFPIDRATREQQHAFREWELSNEFRRAKESINAAPSAGEKARLISLTYLKPASKEFTARDRANIAEAIIRRVRPR